MAEETQLDRLEASLNQLQHELKMQRVEFQNYNQLYGMLMNVALGIIAVSFILIVASVVLN